MRLKVFAAFCLTLLFAAVCLVPGDAARAQRARRRGAQATPSPQASAPAAQPDRPKHVIVGRGSDTERGSRMTITSDNPLNDYSAYRSGDRFYVELPNANADTAARAAGKGFSDLQVQRRGKNVILSYRVKPGAKPRVEQRFNRLEVVFEVPEGGEASAAQTQPAAEGNQQGRAGQAQPASQPAAEQTPAGDRRAQAAAPAAGQTDAAQPPLTSAPPAAVAGQPAATEQAAATGPAPTPVEGASPAAAQPPANEVAQAQAPAPPAPGAATRAAAPAGSGTSIGAFLLRNWTMVLVAALLLVGVGLLVAARRSSSSTRTPAEAPDLKGTDALKESPAAPKLMEADLPAASAGAAATAAASLAAAKAAAKESKKAAKKSKKERAAEAAGGVKPAVAAEKQQPAVVADRKTADAPAETSAAGATAADAAPAVADAPPVVAEVASAEPAVQEASAAEPSVADVPAAETPTTEAAAPAEASTVEPQTPTVGVAEVAPVVAGLAVIGAAQSGAAADDEAKTEPAAEAKGVEPFAPADAETTKEIAPVVALDPDRAREETKRLLEGEDYDRAIISTRDAMARQMVAAELLAALSGRNPERHDRARAAFIEHGYFDEKAEDLRAAKASAERASAARALGLASDRTATPHLVGALEDEAVEVRRAAVESLASLRDPAAVAPLEALLRREKKSKTKVNRKLVEHAVETCRAGVAEEPARVAAPVVAEAPVAEAAVAEPAESAVEAAPVEEVTTQTHIAPAAEAPAEPVAESATAETVEAPSLFVETPVVEEAETIEVARPASFEEVSPAVETPVVEEESAAAVEEETVEVEAAGAASPVGLAATESAVEAQAEPAAEDLTPAVEEAAAEPVLFEEVAEAPRAEEAVAEEPASSFVAPPAEKQTAAGRSEWVEFDMGELGADAPAAPAETPAETPEAAAVAPFAAESQERAAAEPFVFETSAGLPATSEYHAAEPSAAEPFAAESPTAEAPRAQEVSVAPSAGEEKGVAPFDEYSAVPASIQQRLHSQEPEERAAAVTELGRVDTSEAFQQLCAAFDDDAKEVRASAARALYDMQGDRADTFTRALREASAERRRNIGAAIATSGLASDAISQLTGESREKTYEAFSLLFLMAKAGEVQPLVRAIEAHPNSEVRLAVVKLLALSGQKEILPAFRRLAVRGSLPTEVRSAVMEAIYQISSQTETTPAA